MVNLTTSALKSSPLENFTPCRSLNRQVVASTASHDSASFGRRLSLGSRSTSESYRWWKIFCSSVVRWVRESMALIERGTAILTVPLLVTAGDCWAVWPAGFAAWGAAAAGAAVEATGAAGS